jgi:hypothetical protein
MVDLRISLNHLYGEFFNILFSLVHDNNLRIICNRAMSPENPGKSVAKVAMFIYRAS